MFFPLMRPTKTDKIKTSKFLIDLPFVKYGKVFYLILASEPSFAWSFRCKSQPPQLSLFKVS